MACNGDYLEPDSHERESVRVLGFLYEVGLRDSAPGYYGSTNTIHQDIAELCNWCKNNDVSKQSLELQIWWRDHQQADRKREEKEEQSRLKNEMKKQALSKLTDEDRKVLGV
jgi:hypothetical protein